MKRLIFGILGLLSLLSASAMAQTPGCEQLYSYQIGTIHDPVTCATVGVSGGTVAGGGSLMTTGSGGGGGTVNQGTAGTSAQSWFTRDLADGPVAPGTAAAVSILTGGVFNTTLPTLTNGQQSAFQVNSNGEQIVADTNFIAQGTAIGSINGLLEFGSVTTGIPSYTTGQVSPLSLSILGGLRVCLPAANLPNTCNGIAANVATTLTSSNNASLIVSGTFLSTPLALSSGQGLGLMLNSDGSLITAGRYTTPTTAAATNNLLAKSSAGLLISGYAVNQTATAAFLIGYNSATVPATGALTSANVIDCVQVPASGSGTLASVSPTPYSAGIVLLVSSGANCTTYTTGTVTAFINAKVQ